MNLNELRGKRNQAWNAAKALVESKSVDGLLSEEDTKAYSEMEKKVRDYSAAVERAEQMEAMDRELSKPVNTPIVSKPMAADEETGRASKEYKEAMAAALRSNFSSISNVLREGEDSEGGYLVPEEYDSRLIDVLESENIMRSLATKIPTEGKHKINITASKPAASWIEEGGDFSFGDAAFEQIWLDAHKLHVAIKVTNELLYDNVFDLENHIINKEQGEILKAIKHRLILSYIYDIIT